MQEVVGNCRTHWAVVRSLGCFVIRICAYHSQSKSVPFLKASHRIEHEC
jgi:hypothetical protein